jgi:hypothetical protein
MPRFRSIWISLPNGPANVAKKGAGQDQKNANKNDGNAAAIAGWLSVGGDKKLADLPTQEEQRAGGHRQPKKNRQASLELNSRLRGPIAIHGGEVIHGRRTGGKGLPIARYKATRLLGGIPAGSLEV